MRVVILWNVYFRLYWVMAQAKAPRTVYESNRAGQFQEASATKVPLVTLPVAQIHLSIAPRLGDEKV